MDGRRGGRAGASLSTDRRAVREAARRRRAQRGAAISALSTVVALGALAALILTSKGWPNVRDTFFSWTAFKDAFPDVLDGFWLDIKIFVVVEVAVLVLGATYTDIFRGIPTILVVYLIGFGVPALELSGLPTDPVVLGGIALTLSYSAYVAEVYRAGIDSIHAGQRSAALALGLTPAQSTRFVVLPQAVRRVVPPLLNDFIALQKDVALVSILGPLEAFRVAQIEASANFIYTPLVAAAALYLCVTVPLALLLDRWERKRRR